MAEADGSLYTEQNAIQIWNDLRAAASRGGEFDLSVLHRGHDDGRLIIPEDPEQKGFTGIQFASGADFRSIRFKGRVRFRGARFGDVVNFQSAHFEGPVDFSEAFFASEAIFIQAEFDNGATFERAMFKGVAGICLARFIKEVSFNSVRFEERVDFAGTSFFRSASFVNAEFKRWSGFARTVFHKSANFSSAIVHNELVLPFASDIPRPFRCSNGAAEAYRLAKQSAQNVGNYTAAGHYHYAEQVFMNKAAFRVACYRPWQGAFWRGSRSPLRAAGGFILGRCLFGYGERPLRVIGAWVIVITLFSCIYARTGLIHASAPDKPAYDWISALYFSMVTFATLGYGDVISHGTYRLLAAFEALIGAGLMSLFIVALARKFTR